MKFVFIATLEFILFLLVHSPLALHRLFISLALSLCFSLLKTVLRYQKRTI